MTMYVCIDMMFANYRKNYSEKKRKKCSSCSSCSSCS